MPTIAAMTYKYSLSQVFVYPLDELHFTENFLHMLFASPRKKYKVYPVLAKALDKVFILHADHEQNASTSTVRTCGSSGSNPFAAVSVGISSLRGPSSRRS
jgi:citrate synthase